MPKFCKPYLEVNGSTLPLDSSSNATQWECNRARHVAICNFNTNTFETGKLYVKWFAFDFLSLLLQWKEL